jgi:D-sedoheptulose 7-phosphate isomerase
MGMDQGKRRLIMGDVQEMNHYIRLFERYPSLAPLKTDFLQAYSLISRCFRMGGKLLVCGNGGSAADADHIVGELMKGFYKRRKLSPEMINQLGVIGEKLQGALPAIALTQHTALYTAFTNDMDAAYAFAQQVYGYGREHDVLFALSTSGNAKNVIHAVETANALGLATVGLTGKKGGKLKKICQSCINVPADITADIQELHLPVYHTLCAMLEEEFFT